MPRRPKVGDVIEIPLPDGRKGYAQFVYLDSRQGPMIQVLDLIAEDTPSVDLILASPPMFPPVITGLFAAARTGMWKVLGNYPVVDFKYPGFVSANYDSKTGEARVWFLWNGERYERIGERLPEEIRGLEYLVVWDPHDIVDRIVTGQYPFPYKDLMEKGRFLPRQSEWRPAE